MKRYYIRRRPSKPINMPIHWSVTAEAISLVETKTIFTAVTHKSLWLCDIKVILKAVLRRLIFEHLLGSIQLRNYAADSQPTTSFLSGCERREACVSDLWDKRTVSVF